MKNTAVDAKETRCLPAIRGIKNVTRTIVKRKETKAQCADIVYEGDFVCCYVVQRLLLLLLSTRRHQLMAPEKERSIPSTFSQSAREPLAVPSIIPILRRLPLCR